MNDEGQESVENPVDFIVREVGGKIFVAFRIVVVVVPRRDVFFRKARVVRGVDAGSRFWSPLGYSIVGRVVVDGVRSD